MTLDWIYSYLSDRTQFVKVNDGISDVQNLVYGVPQGSVLDQCSIHSTLHLWEILQDYMAYPITFTLMILSYTYPSRLHLSRIWSLANQRKKSVLRILTHG